MALSGQAFPGLRRAHAANRSTIIACGCIFVTRSNIPFQLTKNNSHK